MECWKSIVGWERYEVSDIGNIRNAKTGRVRNLTPNEGGYLTVGLHRDGGQKTFLVHRLVAEAFIPNPSKKTQVNHINGSPSDNRIENLEWVTSKENCLHAHRVLMREASGWCKPRVEVLCVETGVVYRSCRAAARCVGGTSQGICRVCRGERKTHRGYHWKYTE